MQAMLHAQTGLAVARLVQLCTAVNNLLAPHNICVRKAEMDSGREDQCDLLHCARQSFIK